MKRKKHTIALDDELLAELDAIAASRSTHHNRLGWADILRTAGRDYVKQHGPKPPPDGLDSALWFRAVHSLKTPTSVSEVVRRMGATKAQANIIVKGLRAQGMWPSKGGGRG